MSSLRSVAGLAVGSLALLGALAVPAGALSIHEFPLSGAPTPGALTTGPDGNLWFTTLNAGEVLRMSSTGTVNGTFAVTGNLETEIPVGITTGPDGNIWFTEAGGDKIGRLTVKGVLKEFSLSSGAAPVDIASGPDGNLWFTEAKHDKIGRITPSGAITEFPLTTGAEPVGIVTGPDGQLWFTEAAANKIGQITTTGTIHEFPVPSSEALPAVIVVGPDNNLWFTEVQGDQIGRITTAGTVTEFGLPSIAAGPADIITGPDGNLWFTEIEGGRIATITPQGSVTEFTVPTAQSGPAGIAVGPDGAIWFTELQANKVARLTPQPGPACTPSATTLCLDDQIGDARWQVGVSFTSPTAAGSGDAIGLSSVGVTHGGLFWFFSADNPEMLIKVLNGCGVNGHFWIFYAATTNVGFKVSVRDTKTGFVKLYSNKQNTAAPPEQDTSAEVCTAGDSRVNKNLDGELASWTSEQRAWLMTAPQPVPLDALPNGTLPECFTSGTTLCIGGRFKVTVGFANTKQSGSGTAIDVSGLGVSQGGLFWFFDPTNPEMLVKVLNGCAINNHYWVFYAATTNVGFGVKVTDLNNGQHKTYINVNGTAAPPVQDTSALPCP